MSDKRRAKLIFDKWKADLRDKDKSYKNLSSNFDELFYSMHMSGVEFDAAHDYLKDAVTAHMFSRHIAKATYQKTKSKKTFEEFCADWKQGIADIASQAFFAWYTIEGETEPERDFGAMSPREYSLQRKHVDTFPHVDLDKLRKQQAEILNEGFEKLEVPDVKDSK